MRYSQVPGIDFQESLAPVINDVTFRILLIAKIVWSMKAKIIDIETACLHGNLDKEIYIDVLPGLGVELTKRLVIRKAIY